MISDIEKTTHRSKSFALKLDEALSLGPGFVRNIIETEGTSKMQDTK